MNRTAFRALIIRHEGWRQKVYIDTAGKPTIGVGRNLVDMGLNDDEVEALLEHDTNRVFRELLANVASFGSLDDMRQHALMDMAFNMGLTRLLGFKKMLAAIEAHDWPAAAAEILNSTWAKQVGNRAVDLVLMMRQEN